LAAAKIWRNAKKRNRRLAAKLAEEMAAWYQRKSRLGGVLKVAAAISSRSISGGGEETAKKWRSGEMSKKRRRSGSASSKLAA